MPYICLLLLSTVQQTHISGLRYGAIAIGIVAVASILPIRIAIARYQSPLPQGILVLEGQTQRIYFAAKFATEHPTLPIWVSGNPRAHPRNQSIFRDAGIASTQVYYDFCATDTVTNFTCTVSLLKEHDIDHVYVITSDYHMPRSLAIATFVFGSRGITVTPISVDSDNRLPESPIKTIRDCLRSIFWILTRKTGAELRIYF